MVLFSWHPMGNVASTVRGYFSGNDENSVDHLQVGQSTASGLPSSSPTAPPVPAGVDPNEIAWLKDVYVQDGANGDLTRLLFQPDPAPVLLAGSDYPTVHIVDEHASVFGRFGERGVVL